MMQNKGQVGVVVAILVVVLLVSVLAVIQLHYVPRWMEEREAEHMDVVTNQFANLKYAVDLISIGKISSPITNSITLGSKELPYFLSSRSFDSLQILSSHGSNFTFVLEINGYGYEEKNVTYGNGTLSNIISVKSLELNINKLNIGDYYNISFSDNSSISIKVDEYGDYCRINLTVKGGNEIILNQTIFSGLDIGSSFFIDLMNENYAFSKKVFPYMARPFNATFSVSNGNFCIIYEGYITENKKLSFPLGTIIYKADNAYFVDQSYVYEGGAVFLSQHDGNTILFPPSLEIENSSRIVNLTLIDVIAMPGKAGVAGYGTYLVRVNYSSSASYKYFGNVTIKVESNYNYSWNRFLNKTFNESGIEYEYIESSGEFRFNDVEFAINIAKVYAQVGPGWVE
ncbi:MAG: hypothetical protein H5T44_00165 [Thermoplasmatales archaeon]|nr:hypothetical protein [Thermoplasmatales archaeon]